MRTPEGWRPPPLVQTVVWARLRLRRTHQALSKKARPCPGSASVLLLEKERVASGYSGPGPGSQQPRPGCRPLGSFLAEFVLLQREREPGPGPGREEREQSINIK